MERLTNIGSNGEVWITDNDETRKFGRKETAYKKLAEYEDAEEQGLLLRLPCKVGDTIYILDRDGQPRRMIMDKPDIRCHCSKEDNLCMVLCDRKNTGVCAYRFCNDGSDIGKTVFLKQAEAEQKLKEMESD